MTESPHHLRRFFFFSIFFFSTTYRYKHEENEGEPSWQHEDLIKNHKNEAADHRKNQEATKNSPRHTYGDFFFFNFFFGTTYRRKHDENEGEPSWQHEDLIKNHRKEAADHRKNQEATKNSPRHTYGDFLFFTFFHLKIFFCCFFSVCVCESWDVSPPTAETGSPDHLQRFFFFFFFFF